MRDLERIDERVDQDWLDEDEGLIKDPDEAPTNKIPLEVEGLIIDLINEQQTKASSSSRRQKDCEKKEADCPSRGKTAIKRTEILDSVLSGMIVEVPGVT